MRTAGATTDAPVALPSEKAKKRILGLDVARALAIGGMVLINYMNGLEPVEMEPAWLAWFFHLFEGRASVTFVTLAGVGVTLLSRRALLSGSSREIWSCRFRLLRRAAFLLVLGVPFFALWPGDILHFYAFYIAISAFLITVPSWGLAAAGLAAWAGALAWGFLAEQPHYGHIGGHFYRDFYTLTGFFRNTLFNGYHRVFPWMAYLIAGMWIGRHDLSRNGPRKWFLLGAVVAAVLAETVDHWGFDVQREQVEGAVLGPLHDAVRWFCRLPSKPHDFFSRLATAAAVIMMSLMASDRLEQTRIVRALASAGQLALTIYLAHVMLVLGGLVLAETAREMVTGAGHGIFDNWSLRHAQKLIGGHSLVFVAWLSLGFYVSAVAFAVLWRKRFRQGPLEWLMRRLAG